MQPGEVSAAGDLTGSTIGRFVVRRRLGGGGMGEVYLGEDTRLKRPVALKRVSPRLRADERARQHFLKEAERASRLNHPGIAAVYDALEYEGESFLVMEYVEGETLRKRMDTSIPAHEFLDLAIQCADALAAAHARNVLHCDLKPENIMLTPAGRVKILDFGLARIAAHAGDTVTHDDAPSESRHVPGTPGYIAPEILLGEEPGPQSDLFSLGIVLYEMLAGRHPFPARQQAAGLDRTLREAQPPITGLNPMAPPALKPLVAKLLSKDPGERYANAAELAADLRAIARGRKPGARPRRRMLMVAAVALVALGPTAFFFVRWARKPAGPMQRARVLVADFEDRTGGTGLDQTLRELLATTLEQSPYVSVFPAARLPEVLRRMKRRPDVRIDVAVGREICQREGLQAVVSGSISRMGNSYVLVVRAVSPTGETLASAQETADDSDHVPAALDAIARSLRTSLGESLTTVRNTSLPLAQVTSSSLEAIRYFSMGKNRLYAGDARQAVTFFERSVELDHDFAMAHEYLGIAYWHLYDSEHARQHLYEASRLADRVTEGEKQKILGDYYLLIRDDDRALEHLRLLVQLRPDDAAAHLNLAACYTDTYRFQSAILELEQAVQLQPDSGTRFSLAVVYFLSGNNDRGLALISNILQAEPLHSRALEYLGKLQMARGDLVAAGKTFKRISEKGGSEESTGRLGLADLALAAGHPSEAQAQLEVGILVDTALSNHTAAAQKRLVLAEIYLDSRNLRRFKQLMAESEKAADDPEIVMQAGVLYARAHDFTHARVKLRAIEDALARDNVATLRSFAEILRAEIALSEGRKEAAVNAAEQAVRHQRSTLALETLSQVYEATGRPNDAIRNLELVLGRGNERVAMFDGSWLHRLVMDTYRVAALYDQIGRKREAISNLRKFLDYWSHADAGLAPYQDAKKRLERLEGAPLRTGSPTPAT